MKDCPSCDGKGWILFPFNACTYCAGTGKKKKYEVSR